MQTGKSLEQLVHAIEEFLLPSGFSILANERVYDEKGIQIAEFDLVIEGRVSHKKYRWLIECRDRPTQGPQPGAWIEQLVGRKIRFEFSRVTAVSTTGFAQGVKSFADQQDIELCVVNDINTESIKTWFLSDTVNVSRIGGYLQGFKLFPSRSEPELALLALREVTSKIKLDEPILQSLESGKTISAIDAYGAAVSALLHDPEGIPSEDSQPICLQIKYDGKPRYVIATDVGNVGINEMIFDGIIFHQVECVPIQRILQYGLDSGEHTMAQSVKFDLPLHAGRADLEFHRLLETGETKVLLRRQSY